METTDTTNHYPFLAGGGEMGERTRTHDWSRTFLGLPHQWPYSLRVSVSNILRASLPMLVLWGDEQLCFYNDAVIPSLGPGRHPSIGQSARSIWTEGWDFVGPLLAQVLKTGESVTFQDTPMNFYRQGQTKLVYWTFSYSQILNDQGEPGGVLVSCLETTQAVESRQALQRSQESYQNLLTNAPVAIALFRGPDFVIELANERVLEYWGRQREEVINKPLFKALPEASGQGFEELLTGVYTTGERFEASELVVTLERQGRLEPTYVNLVYEPYRETDGTIGGVTVVCVEVTEQVLARKQIEDSESKLRAIITTAPAGIGLFVGRDLVIENPNKTFIDIVGKGPAIVGLPLREAMPELTSEGQPFLQILDEIFTTGEPFISPGSLVKIVQNGVLNDNYYNISYSPIRNAAGEVYAILDIAIDVTAQVKAQQALAESEARYRVLSTELEQLVQERTEELAATNEELAAINEELTASNEELAASYEETEAANEELTESNYYLARSNDNLERFAYVASHDLQEPLRKVQSFGDLLKEHYGAQLGEGAAYLDRMQAAANRMSTLIRDLLTYSRISTQRDRSKSVSLADVVDRVLTSLELRIQETGASINIDPLPTVLGDPAQFEQLFQNLIGNALKFHRAGVHPVIQLRVGQTANQDLPQFLKPVKVVMSYHRIDVIDNGVGFDEKYLDRIFEVFQRLHGKSEFDGTGIGLAICEKVVANHGGAITATSQPGQGATFSVYLPL